MDNMPLYKDAIQNQPQGPGHLGLLHEKFFNCWNFNERKVEIPKPSDNYEGGKLKWIKHIAQKPAGDQKRLDEAIARRKSLIGNLGALSEHKLLAPFVTGMGYEHPIENGFVWHHTLGVPYLPASGVKGLIRAWARDYLNVSKNNIACIFGEADAGAGNWIFFDALPLCPVELAAEVMTPHDAGWRIAEVTKVTPSDWISPKPIHFLVVQPGAKFQFAFAPRYATGSTKSEKDAVDCRKRIDVEREMIHEWLKDALEYLGGGAKTAVGFGRFERGASGK